MTPRKLKTLILTDRAANQSLRELNISKRNDEGPKVATVRVLGAGRGRDLGAFRPPDSWRSAAPSG